MTLIADTLRRNGGAHVVGIMSLRPCSSRANAERRSLESGLSRRPDWISALSGSFQ
jgi:hypothetical protein